MIRKTLSISLLLAAALCSPQVAQAADARAVQCAPQMRDAIHSSLLDLDRLGSTPVGREFIADVGGLIDEFDKLDWEGASKQDAREAVEEAGRIETTIATMTRQLKELKKKADELSEQAQSSGSAKAMCEIHKAQDAIKAGALAMSIFWNFTEPAKAFDSCVLAR